MAAEAQSAEMPEADGETEDVSESGDGGETEEPYINAADGLDRLAANSGDELDELPRAIILTGIRADVFDDDTLRERLEDLCRTVSADVSFQWLRSFRRVRANYANPACAAAARVSLHRLTFPEAPTRIGAYFAQPVTPGASSLHPPKPKKQFLISPPASPPVGWEPRQEAEPLVNRDLLAALAALAPGDMQELVPSRGSQPAIVVHAAHAANTANAASPSDCQ